MAHAYRARTQAASFRSGRWPSDLYSLSISLLIASMVFGSIWLPEVLHWYVRPVAVTESVLSTARTTPDRRVLDEVIAMQLRGVTVEPDDIVPTAEGLVRGTLKLPSFPPGEINLPFAPDDLRRGSPTWQLMVAALAPADVLLDAYRQTRRDEFLFKARDAIVEFARYESASWVDHGFMWNDHAIGARVAVLAKFWSEYRDRPDFDPRVGRIVLALVGRSAQLLAKPSFYTWRTSHGIVEDLALLQIATAFPYLAASTEARRVGVERFRNHLPYLVDPEGVTLLHSAGYHSGTLYHFGMALRLFTLNGVVIPPDWWTKYEKAIEFYRLLKRPDGTLPMFGDTNSLPQPADPLLTVRSLIDGAAEPLRQRLISSYSEAFAVYPVAGHSIAWDRSTGQEPAGGTQTVVTWSYHPGLGHKLADELSMLVWANGRSWITNVGYWPYAVWGRDHAESWEGSNAPHLSGEGKDSQRSSRARRFGRTDRVTFLDVERTGPGSYAVARQIVRLVPEQAWLVLDRSRDAVAGTTITNWTFWPDLAVTTTQTPGRYVFASRDSPVAMVGAFSGSRDVSTSLAFGSKDPFAGWVTMDRTPVPAPAVTVRQPSRDSWSLATFTLLPAALATRSGNEARMAKWEDAEHWAAVLQRPSGNVTVTRTGDRLLVDRDGSPDSDDVSLVTRDAPPSEVRVVQDALLSASRTYHKFPELYSYRLRVTYLLLVVLVSQELILFAVSRRWRPAAGALRVACWACWVVGGIWLFQVYFSVAR